MTENEQFKPFPMAPAVKVGNLGTIIRPNGRKASVKPDNVGYLKITIYIDGVKTAFKQHRVVALTWIDNPLNLPEVNHKDGIKSHNAASNLEWSTHAENIQHGRAAGLWIKPSGRPHGFKISEETRQKMREAKQGKKRDGLRGSWL